MISKEKVKNQARKRRHKKIRAKVFGTEKIPRLNLHRSNKGLFIQLIDDEKGSTLFSVSSKKINLDGKKIAVAKEAGKMIAKKAQEKDIKKVVFDRGGYKYHGRVKAVAEGAREGGLEF